MLTPTHTHTHTHSPPDNHAVDFPATFDIDGGNSARGNAAAGSTRIAFRYAGEPCLDDNTSPTYDEVCIVQTMVIYCIAGYWTVSFQKKYIFLAEACLHFIFMRNYFLDSYTESELS